MRPATKGTEPTSGPAAPIWSVLAFVALLAVRLVAAARAPIMDCDETFNYWEPLHYVLHGSGMQTWEYSPQFALRSYVYIELHALVLRLLPASAASGPAGLAASRSSCPSTRPAARKPGAWPAPGRRRKRPTARTRCTC